MLTDERIRMTYGLPSREEEIAQKDLLEKGKAAPIGEVRTWSGQQYVKHADGWVHVHPTTGKVSVLPTSGPVRKTEGNEEHREHFEKHTQGPSGKELEDSKDSNDEKDPDEEFNNKVNAIQSHANKSKDNAVQALKSLGQYKEGDERKDHHELKRNVSKALDYSSETMVNGSHQALTGKLEGSDPSNDSKKTKLTIDSQEVKDSINKKHPATHENFKDLSYEDHDKISKQYADRAEHQPTKSMSENLYKLSKQHRREGLKKLYAEE